MGIGIVKHNDARRIYLSIVDNRIHDEMTLFPQLHDIPISRGKKEFS